MEKIVLMCAWRRTASFFLLVSCSVTRTLAGEKSNPISPTNIFAPDFMPAYAIYRLSVFELEILCAIFVVVFSLLAYAVVKFRQRTDDDAEPPQVYGSNQMELAWTVLPVLIVVVLFLSAAQVIHRVQDARRPPGAIEVTVVAHQFWWEYRYPQYGFTAANELHVPVSDPTHPTPTFLSLALRRRGPQLLGSAPRGQNGPDSQSSESTWIDPQETGLFLGQCAQYCGTQHAKMLLSAYTCRVARISIGWVHEQQQPAVSDPSAARGSALFHDQACFSCHTVRGTPAGGSRRT